MALTRAQIAGIAVAIFITVLSIVTFIISYCHNRNLVKQPDDAEAQAEPELQLPGPLVQDNSRKTHPQTFYDWVRSGNDSSTRHSPVTTTKIQPKQHRHDRYPSLEHGPGPVIRSRPIVTQSVSTPTTAPKVERPGSDDSIKASSLHQAVLDIGGSKGQGEGKKEPRKLEEKSTALSHHTFTQITKTTSRSEGEGENGNQASSSHLAALRLSDT
ncbi:uncharacterized protein K460DRAFT_418358 [Cucurbitaria berberidis CBS 394.84]|uniref:Uncharacterized protein n=1 Tax=Cucurbitaria berberidis CBS 394.84 TaxID=1168544 RepID=A0A9P4GDK4_9PLEO|nr:uncharacterized protein K460DRAFT_418358 [Cucurbitaria berberidis CBS 394.84]KAF1843265.1 hypothetical protein K460DRAFT_418358 [Cucurbitaria berberidis CBS 394.84]